MLRIIMWGILYVVCLGAISIKAEYADGLIIKFHGWLKLIHTRR